MNIHSLSRAASIALVLPRSLAASWTRGFVSGIHSVRVAVSAPVLALALASPLSAGAVFIANHSFENDNLSDCTFNFSPVGWTPSTGSTGSWDPGPPASCPHPGFSAGIPDGAQVGYTNSGVLSQVLAETLEADQTYLLRVLVGRRSDGYPMESYRIRLYAGATLLVEDIDNVDPPLGGWSESVLGFYAPNGHPALGQPLKIEFVKIAGAQANFDNVRLEKGFADCNSNGVSDHLDIALGILLDTNANGVPDECEAIEPGIPGDIDGDGDVDGADLGQLLGEWGQCSDCDDCPSDLDDDCDVDGGDLGVLLASWG